MSATLKEKDNPSHGVEDHLLDLDLDDDDIFHSVTMTEETSWQEGYASGKAEGRKRGFEDGFHLGAQKGTDLGKEVGFYAGYAAYVLKVHKEDNEGSSSRAVSVAKAILSLVNTMQGIDPTDEALTDKLGKIQGKFKQLTSLLGVSVEYSVVGGDIRGASF